MLFQHTVGAASKTDFNLSDRTSNDYENCIVGPGDPRRAEIEQFIGARFAAVHGAHINSFMTQLIALYDANGVIKSAIGIRNASNTRLFLEHYLDVSVEKSIADHTGNHAQQATRKQIVEVGNLASTDRDASRRLFEFLAHHLIQCGYQWVVFTGCNSLQRVFKRMHIELISLGNADQHRLPRELGSWGRYYDKNPQVMAGSILGALTLVQSASTRMQRERA